MKLLQNKTTLITGASRGIGKGIAIEFAKQGSDIAFTFNASVEAAKENARSYISFKIWNFSFANFSDNLLARPAQMHSFQRYGMSAS